MRRATPIEISAAERSELDRMASSSSSHSRAAVRAWIVLRASQGATNRAIAKEFLVDVATVALWRRRFLVHRIGGIVADAPRSGRRPRIPASLVARIVEASEERDPTFKAASSRALARKMNVSQSTIVRIWRTHPSHRREFSPESPGGSTIPPRAVRDVRGMYISREDRAIVLISELPSSVPSNTDPESPSLPPSARAVAGEAGRRPGKDPLAAARVLYRTRLSDHRSPHRSRDFLVFLRGIESGLAPGEEAHVLVQSDRLAKEAAVLRWFRARPSLNLYSGAPAAPGENPEFVVPNGLTTRGVRAGSLRGMPKLVDAFRTYSASYAGSPRPFVWSAFTPSITSRRTPRSARSSSRWGSEPGSVPRAPADRAPSGETSVRVSRFVTEPSLAFLPLRPNISGASAGPTQSSLALSPIPLLRDPTVPLVRSLPNPPSQPPDGAAARSPWRARPPTQSTSDSSPR